MNVTILPSYDGFSYTIIWDQKKRYRWKPWKTHKLLKKAYGSGTVWRNADSFKRYPSHIEGWLADRLAEYMWEKERLETDSLVHDEDV